MRSISSKKSHPSTFPKERPALTKKKATSARIEKMVYLSLEYISLGIYLIFLVNVHSKQCYERMPYQAQRYTR